MVLVATLAACGSLGPQPSQLGAAGGADAYRLAEGHAPGGPWSYWVWTSSCEDSGATALWQWVEYEPLHGGVALALDRCFGAEDPAQIPFGVERSGVGDNGWSFFYGQTRPDVVRVAVRLVNGRTIDVDTIAAPIGLGWDARFYVTYLPVDIGRVDTVRGYDASGQEVGE
jgi:hypothetical protein